MEITKKCIKCETEKPLTEFVKRPSSKDGYRGECKTCNRLYHKGRLSDPIKREKERDRLRDLRESWTEDKWEEYRAYCRKYAKENPHVVLKNTRNRQARLLQATPLWADNEFERFFIEEIYHLSKLRESCLNNKFNVDHITPLRSDFVCGLHCSSNLQILPDKQNKSKNNRFWPDMPLLDDELLAMIASFKQTQGEVHV